MLEQCLHAITSNGGLISSLFIGGLVGSTTHCTMMCGAFILAQSPKSQTNQPFLIRLKGAALLPYHLGRITTYVFLGILFSSVLNLAFLFQPLRIILIAPLLILAGIMFITLAFPNLQHVFPWVQKIRIPVPYRRISKAVGGLSPNMSVLNRYFMGILLGFIPCGLVVSALMASSAANNVLGAALAMSAFGLGTIPALFGLALGGDLIKRSFPKAEKKLTQGLMLGSAVWLFILAGQAIF